MEVKLKSALKLNQLVRSHSVDWQPLDEPDASGVYVKVLRFDAAAGRAPTILLKFDPGATYPGHIHPGGKRFSFLRGISAWVKTGCTLVIISTRRRETSTLYNQTAAASCW